MPVAQRVVSATIGASGTLRDPSATRALSPSRPPKAFPDLAGHVMSCVSAYDAVTLDEPCVRTKELMMIAQSHGVVPIGEEQRVAAAAVLARAFYDDPLFVQTFPDPAERGRCLPAIFRWHVHASSS